MAGQELTVYVDQVSSWPALASSARMKGLAGHTQLLLLLSQPSSLGTDLGVHETYVFPLNCVFLIAVSQCCLWVSEKETAVFRVGALCRGGSEGGSAESVLGREAGAGPAACTTSCFSQGLLSFFGSSGGCVCLFFLSNIAFFLHTF